ncbi:ABC transporter substrate-binding protein [Aureibacillus halotolerans]|nr:ABC transporter substrate-binding protein [Aureibacillus halotolerans]
MKKQQIKWVMLCLLCILTACGGNSSSAPSAPASNETNNQEAETFTTTLTEPVELEFWHAMTGDHETALKAIVDTFNSEHENITVKPVPQGNYGDLQQKIMAAAKAKNLPAIAQATSDAVPMYAANDFLISFTPYVENEEVGLSEEELEDVVEVFRASSQWNNEYYAMPFSKSTRILFYNQGLLEENGQEVPTTWGEVRSVAEAITTDTVTGMGFENDLLSEFQAVLKQMGGQYMEEETGEITFNTDEGIAALTLIDSMIADGIARTAGEDGFMSNPFGRGDVGMYIGSSAGLPFVAAAAEGNIEWGASTLPSFEGTEATQFAGNDVVAFNQGTQEEQLASWLFAKYLISPEVTADWSMKTGYLPVRYSAQELPEYQAYVEENPGHAVGTKQFDAGFFTARLENSNAVRTIVNEEIENAILDRKSVEEALLAAEERGTEELGN